MGKKDTHNSLYDKTDVMSLFIQSHTQVSWAKTNSQGLEKWKGQGLYEGIWTNKVLEYWPKTGKKLLCAMPISRLDYM